MNSRQQRKAWNANGQEDYVLSTLVKKHGKKRWNNVSEQLNEKIQGSSRTPQQCKQRWTNCLCPGITKSKVDKRELTYIFDEHKKRGNKWTQICIGLNKKFGKHRTDATIKNQFNSALRRSMRRIAKLLGRKNSTDAINKVKPHILLQLLSLDNEGSTNINTNTNSNINQQKQFKNRDQLYDLLRCFSDDDYFGELKEKAESKEFRDKIQYLLKKVDLMEQQQEKIQKKTPKKQQKSLIRLSMNKMEYSQQYCSSSSESEEIESQQKQKNSNKNQNEDKSQNYNEENRQETVKRQQQKNQYEHQQMGLENERIEGSLMGSGSIFASFNQSLFRSKGADNNNVQLKRGESEVFQAIQGSKMSLFQKSSGNTNRNGLMPFPQPVNIDGEQIKLETLGSINFQI